MELHKETVSDTLWNALTTLMNLPELDSFRLVGGTSLSLLMGHRMSVDIDLFTDAEYDSIDFDEIDKLLEATFPVVEPGYGGNNSMGKTYFVGYSDHDTVKLDMFYNPYPFQFEMIEIDGIRLACKEEIAAMKLEVVGNGGRKKDIWDLHELKEHYSLTEMLEFFEKRQPFSHSKEDVITMLTNFKTADEDFDPICMRNKHWQLIKLDFEDWVQIEFT